MASYNRVILVGNLTRDPELRYIPSGTAVTVNTGSFTGTLTLTAPVSGTGTIATSGGGISITPVSGQKALIVTDYPVIVSKLQEVIKTLDEGPGGVEVKFVPIKNADPSSVATTDVVLLPVLTLSLNDFLICSSRSGTGCPLCSRALAIPTAYRSCSSVMRVTAVPLFPALPVRPAR